MSETDVRLFEGLTLVAVGIEEADLHGPCIPATSGERPDKVWGRRKATACSSDVSVEAPAPESIVLEAPSRVLAQHAPGHGDAAPLEDLDPIRRLRPFVEPRRFRVLGVGRADEALHVGPDQRTEALATRIRAG